MQPENVEVWKNTANGSRWYTQFDVRGQEVTKTVGGNRTFSLTSFERQVNQEKAASPDVDLFRNGNFILVKESAETNRAEIESPNAVTDKELEKITHEIMADPELVDGVLARLTSPSSRHRLWEHLVVEDGPSKVVEKVKSAYHEADGSVVAQRRRIITTSAE